MLKHLIYLSLSNSLQTIFIMLQYLITYYLQLLVKHIRKCKLSMGYTKFNKV